MVVRSARWNAACRAAAGIVAATLCLLASNGARAALRQGPDIDLSTSVQALKQSHPAAADQLPGQVRAQEPEALKVLYKLPLVFQEAYLITCQDYGSLGPGDQQKFGNLVNALAVLPRGQQARLVATLGSKIKAMSKDQIGAARSKPHDTCFLISAALAAKGGGKSGR